MSRSKLYLLACLSFIFGIFLGLLYSAQPIIGLKFFILFFILLILFSGRKRQIATLFFLTLSFGFFYSNYFKTSCQHSILEKFNNKKQKVVLTGFIASEPKIKSKSQSFLVKIKSLNGHNLAKKEGILMTTSKYRSYLYGEKIKLEGKLNSPPIFNGFNYRQYLKSKRIYSLVYYPKILSASKQRKDPFVISYRAILGFKNQLRENINRSFPYPQNLLLRAMVLGDKKDIPQDIKNKLNISGIRHITAISGMHIIILINMLMFFLLFTGFSKKTIFYLITLFVIFFVVMIGFQPSAVRAGIMGLFTVLAETFFKKRDFAVLISSVAALMLLINPLFLLLY